MSDEQREAAPARRALGIASTVAFAVLVVWSAWSLITGGPGPFGGGVFVLVVASIALAARIATLVITALTRRRHRLADESDEVDPGAGGAR